MMLLSISKKSEFIVQCMPACFGRFRWFIGHPNCKRTEDKCSHVAACEVVTELRRGCFEFYGRFFHNH